MSWTAFANILVVFIALGVGYNLTENYFRSFSPIVQLHSDVVSTKKIHSGEDIVFHRTVERDKICRTTVDNFILQMNLANEEVVLSRERMIGGWSRLGKSRAEIHIATPPLPPGTYILRTVVSSDCGERASMSDDIIFEVIK